MLKPGMPSYERLSGQHTKGFMSGEKEAVTEVGTRLSCKVVRLIVEVLVGLGADEIASAHRAPDFLSRSSSRICFSCQ
jgi:hypothetical protein